ncbi:MAG: IS4 family transposase, partial [Coleofasciculus sp. B1-GNL1-01]
SESQLLTLEILLWLLQVHKQVKIERLAALFPVPILYQSRRKHLQRFLVLPNLSLPLIWFPIIKYILRTQIPLGSRVILAIDRTQWDSNNLLMVAVIWKKRSFPVYWQFLDKAGSSNISEQIAVIRPVLKLLSRYEVVLIGDREFRRVELAYWLKKKKVFFALRIKQDTYIRQSEENYQKLSELGLNPGMKLFHLLLTNLTSIFIYSTA